MENISLKSEFSSCSTGTSKKTIVNQSITMMQTNDMESLCNSNMKEQLDLNNECDKLDEILLNEENTYQDIFSMQKSILNNEACDYDMEE